MAYSDSIRKPKFEDGKLVGWKVAWSPDGQKYLIVKLHIFPGRMMRYTWLDDEKFEHEACDTMAVAVQRRIVGKCRSDGANVVCVQNLKGDRLSKNSVAISGRDDRFVYCEGLIVRPTRKFAKSRYAICGPGIHFFLTRAEAVEYRISL